MNQLMMISLQIYGKEIYFTKKYKIMFLCKAERAPILAAKAFKTFSSSLKKGFRWKNRNTAIAVNTGFVGQTCKLS
jgi:hypothetical protein